MNNDRPLQKIFVLGKIAGGKTVLSRRWSELHQLPVTHVDTLQFMGGMKIRPLEETRKALNEVIAQDRWLIDGFGPLDLLEKRFAAADRIVFVDMSLGRHFWWCCKRQWRHLWTHRRKELPEDCDEATWDHTLKLFKTLWLVHFKMRPELLRIFQRESLESKMIYIRNLKEWNQYYKNGLR